MSYSLLSPVLRPVTVAVAARAVGDVPLEALTLKRFEMGWRLGCEGLFRLAKAVTPRMAERGGGCLLVTSATADLRGNAGQHSHSAAMGGRRMLCQSLAHELGPRGVHVCHFIVDGPVDAPDTLGRMLGADRFERLREERGDGMLQPAHVAVSAARARLAGRRPPQSVHGLWLVRGADRFPAHACRLQSCGCSGELPSRRLTAPQRVDARDGSPTLLRDCMVQLSANVGPLMVSRW